MQSGWYFMIRFHLYMDAVQVVTKNRIEQGVAHTAERSILQENVLSLKTRGL